jgi:flagellar protein FliO/FliZ
VSDLPITTFDLLVKLGLVVAFIYGLAWLARRGQPPRSAGDGIGPDIVAAMPLGPGVQLKVVEIGDRALVVAVSRDRVWRLDVIRDAEVLAPIAARSEAARNRER